MNWKDWQGEAEAEARRQFDVEIWDMNVSILHMKDAWRDGTTPADYVSGLESYLEREERFDPRYEL